jgi:hypothetical protein
MVEQIDHGTWTIAHDHLAEPNLALRLLVDGLLTPFVSTSH